MIECATQLLNDPVVGFGDRARFARVGLPVEQDRVAPLAMQVVAEVEP